jgi:hypothetical protein
MQLAAQYAKALFESQKPTITGLRAALKKRGHEKLLPRIYSEYAKLQLQKERRAKATEVTPEQERTRILLELYRKLTA